MSDWWPYLILSAIIVAACALWVWISGMMRKRQYAKINAAVDAAQGKPVTGGDQGSDKLVS